MMAPVVIRDLDPADDLTVITKIIHLAYAQRQSENLRYWATHQTVEDTALRFGWGHALVATIESQIVGTVTIRPPQPESPVIAYRDPTTWVLYQFAVDPAHQGRCIGRKLHDAALAVAGSHGAKFAAIDTAVAAIDLIRMYERWGYSIIGECDWRPKTNYASIVMRRPIEMRATNDRYN